MISASTVLLLTHVCFLLCAASGKKLWGPYRARKTPEVLLIPTLSPAKSASENKPSSSWSASSPMNPICRQATVPLIYFTIRNSFRSHSGVHLVISVESAPTALRRSGRANRAMYIIFISTLQAILESLPRSGSAADVGPPLGGGPVFGSAPFSAAPLAAFLGVSWPLMPSGAGSSIITSGSFASSRNGVGAVPTLASAYPDNSQNAATQSLANLSILYTTTSIFLFGS